MRVVREPLVRYERPKVTATNPMKEQFGSDRNGSAGRGTCRTEDCPHDANTRYDRGPLYGYCEEVCIERAREAMSERGKRARQEHGRGIGPVARVEPAPTPEVEPSLVDLAADLERARGFRDDAEEMYEEAVERFLSHPLVRELDIGYQAEA